MTRTLVPRPGRSVRPFWGLSSGFEDLFEDFWRGARLLPRSEAVVDFAPRVDIEETDDAVRISAELPGLEEKDFEVVLEEDVLTLKGEKRAEREEKREGFYHAERSSGSFQRSFRIPWEVDPAALKAVFKNGVLAIEVPKPAEARSEPRTIPVSTS